MLTINSSSFCDVCAEEYGPRNQPYSIPCAAGHVLCRRCCNSITEKTPARLSPVCPFCREHFTPESVRVIRTDFSASGTSTPAPEHSYQMSDAWSTSNKHHHSVLPERPRTSHSSSKHSRSEAKRLEDKVARVAGQKSSVEEVSKLHDELQAWLSSSASQEEEKEKLTSLYLSAALLRAILMNHFAFSEVTKTAKNVEASLKGKVDDLEMRNEKLESELRKQKQQYSSKAQECQSLRSELSRLKALTSMLGVPSSPAAASDAHRSSSLSPPPSAPTPTPTSPTERPPSTTPVSRFNTTHSRSASQSASSSASSRSATPSHFLRSTTPASHTLRTYTPAPPTPVRSHTPASTSSPSRAKTPGPSTPTSSSRTRRMSVSSSAYQSPPPLPKMVRSSSEEKEPYYRPPSVDPGPPPLTRIRYPSISKAFSLSRS